VINNWFNGRAKASGLVDNLSPFARLRQYTVLSNAIVTLGTSCTDASLINGLSLPTIYQVGVGEDVAFALSYGEAANFVSGSHFMRGKGYSNHFSNAFARANWAKIILPINISGYDSHCMWLRSPGDVSGTAAVTHTYHKITDELWGRTFQEYTNASHCYVFPALWVHQDIFDTKYAITVNYYADSISQSNRIGTVSLPAASAGTPITGIDAYRFAPAGYTTPGTISGDTVVMPRENVVNVLYTKPIVQPQYTITYIANGGSGTMPPAVLDGGTYYAIRDSAFTRFAYLFYRWNTQPDGSGTSYGPYSVIQVNGNLTLYAQWLYLQ
jgi:hypothetical protein